MGPEFLLAFQAARFALDGIRSCVDMLNTGTAEIQRVKKDITQTVDSAKQLYTEVTGFWGWLQKLFAGDGKRPAAEAKPADVAVAEPKPSKQSNRRDEYVDHIPNEDEIVEQFLTHFTNFVEAQTTILDAIAEERERILNVWNPKQNNRKAAIELIRHERRINDMAMELSGVMAAGPLRLGSVRDQFQEKLEIVQEAQRRARDKQKRKEALERAKEYEERDHRINMRLTFFWSVFWVVYVYWWMWAVWEIKNPISR